MSWRLKDKDENKSKTKEWAQFLKAEHPALGSEQGTYAQMPKGRRVGGPTRRHQGVVRQRTRQSCHKRFYHSASVFGGHSVAARQWFSKCLQWGRGVILLTGRHLVMSRDIFSCRNLGGTHWYLVERGCAEGCCTCHSTQGSPTTKNYASSNVS